MTEWLLADADVPNVLMLVVVSYVGGSIGRNIVDIIARLLGENW